MRRIATFAGGDLENELVFLSAAAARAFGRIRKFGGVIALFPPCCGLPCAKMIHRTRLLEKSPRLLGAVFTLAIGWANHAAIAGDAVANAPPTPGQARCNAMGDGFYAIAGSNACIKISGYVAAGADFAAPTPKAVGVFTPRPNGGLTSETAVSADVRLDTPLGPGRLYVQIGHDAYRP